MGSVDGSSASSATNLPPPQAVERPHDEEPRGDAQKKKQIRLVPRGCNAEGQNGALLIPDAIAVACDYPKLVSPRAKVSIESLAPCSWFLPGRIAAFESVSKAHSLWSDKAQRRVVNFEIARKRRKTNLFSRRIVLSVGN